MLERHELDALIAVAEELHFGRAAQRLHVSTTRVSQTIRKLERRVGTPLFDRTSRRVTLTAVGRELYDTVEPAWARIAAGFHRAVEAGRGVKATVRAGFVGVAGGQLLRQAADLFEARDPDCEVRIREAQIGEALAWLRDDVIDVLLTMYPVGGPELVSGGALISEARMLAVPALHPLAARGSVSAAEVTGLPVLQPSTGGAMPAAMPSGQPIEEVPAATFAELLTLVGAGRGVLPVGAHTRRYYPRPDVAYVVFTGAAPVEWGLAWHRDRESPRVLAFNQAALEAVRVGE